MLACIDSLLDECYKLGETYITGKRELKEKRAECEVAIASCDHLEEVCHDLKDQVAELEVELDKCRNWKRPDLPNQTIQLMVKKI